MTPAQTLGFATLVVVLGCAADGGRIHAPASEPDEGASEKGAPNVLVVSYDEPFRLAYSHEVRVRRTKTRARYAELLEDSRCPDGVVCVWAGRARVRLVVRRGNGAPVSIELSTEPEKNLRSAGGVTWELREVEPGPVAGRERRPQDTTLTLVVHPLRSR
jgi:hypothetical protein